MRDFAWIQSDAIPYLEKVGLKFTNTKEENGQTRIEFDTTQPFFFTHLFYAGVRKGMDETYDHLKPELKHVARFA
jgi:hypothetical protein